jgi:hypothetical protein
MPFKPRLKSSSFWMGVFCVASENCIVGAKPFAVIRPWWDEQNAAILVPEPSQNLPVFRYWRKGFRLAFIPEPSPNVNSSCSVKDDSPDHVTRLQLSDIQLLWLWSFTHLNVVFGNQIFSNCRPVVGVATC